MCVCVCVCVCVPACHSVCVYLYKATWMLQSSTMSFIFLQWYAQYMQRDGECVCLYKETWTLHSSTMSFIFYNGTHNTCKEMENVSACIKRLGHYTLRPCHSFLQWYTQYWQRKKERDGETDTVGKTADAEKQHSLLKAKLSEIKLGHQMHRWPVYARTCPMPWDFSRVEFCADSTRVFQMRL